MLLAVWLTACGPTPQSTSSLDASSAHRLHLAWQADLGGSVDARPIIAGDLVLAGSERGWFGAFKRETGATVWLDKGLGPVTATAATGDGLVVVGDLTGHVAAFRVATGKRAWTWAAPGIKPAIWSTPTVWRGSVLVATSSQYGDVPLEAGRLAALNLRTGRPEWVECVRPGCPPGDGIWSSPTIDAAGRAFVGVGNPADGVLAFDAADGRELWLRDFYPDLDRDLDVGATPLVLGAGGGETVDVGSTAGLFESLAAADGAVLWSRRLDAGSAVHGLIGSPAFDGARLLVPSASPPTGVAALSASGATLWWARTDLPVYGAPAVGRGIVVVGAGAAFDPRNTGQLLVLDAVNGALLWRYDAGSAINSSPAIAGTTVVVGDFAGRLLAFAPA